MFFDVCVLFVVRSTTRIKKGAFGEQDLDMNCWCAVCGSGVRVFETTHALIFFSLLDEIPLVGHSIEARIYAENPDNDFLPGSGHLHFVKTPENAGSFGLEADVRIDAGVVQGDDVSIYYDPMISKLIVHGEDREHALRLLDNVSLLVFRVCIE